MCDDCVGSSFISLGHCFSFSASDEHDAATKGFPGALSRGFREEKDALAFAKAYRGRRGPLKLHDRV